MKHIKLMNKQYAYNFPHDLTSQMAQIYINGESYPKRRYAFFSKNKVLYMLGFLLKNRLPD